MFLWGGRVLKARSWGRVDVSVSGGLWGLDRCGCFGWWVD